jgi:hypothetical protein
MEALKVPVLYNGPIETGLRALMLLMAAWPEELDLRQLVALDYLLVHSGDVPDGPESLHAPSPLRAGEISIRHGLIELGLQLYACRGLIERRFGPNGFGYVATDYAPTFVLSVTAEFTEKLVKRADWVYDRFGRLPADELTAVLNQSMERWRSEFVALDSEDLAE